MTDTKKSIHGEWSSRSAFILAATGSAVGLGNIWKFPYITGENGGGAFVMVYLLCVALIGIPIMIAETMLGRRGRENPVHTMQVLSVEAGADNNWRYLGWLGMVAGLLILSYYSVIAGWASAYVFKAFSGSFFAADVTAIEQLFRDFIGSPMQLIFWHTLFMAATLLIVARGVGNGLEKSVRFLMPALFVLLALLLIYAMTTSGYFQGIHFLFSLDFSKLSGNAILIAMGQAFFSLGLGMGCVMVYGAYLPKDISIAKASILIAAVDTLVALLAGIIIFPIVFTHGLNPGSGPGLIFETLPIAFGTMTGGWLFGVLFFVILVFAALSSAIALIEPTVAWLVESRGMSRERACLQSGLVTWLLGFVTIFSFNVWADFKIFGLTLFDLLDYVTANLMLPIGGLAIAVFAGWKMKRQHSEQELGLPNPHYQIWQFLIKYIAPAAVFLVFLDVVGVL
ncbi:MAG: sodium-dependent transporter [Methylovulum sp.]|nr:sodium-dependent transporter [Methylovulum sp.]